MKGYLIDPHARTIKAVKFNDHADMNAMIRVGDDACDTVKVAKNGDMVLVDDLGYQRPNQQFFTFADYGWTLAGKAFIFGRNSDGETTSAQSSKEQILTSVVWEKP